MSKNYPVLNLCCMTCRKASVYEFAPDYHVWCKKKDESVRVFDYCEDWMPSKNCVKTQIVRFHYSKERKD